MDATLNEFKIIIIKGINMALTMAGDLVLDNELIRLGIAEVLEQNVDGFNASSNGTILLGSEALENDFSDESFFKALSAASLVSHRDYTSMGDLTPEKLIEDAVNTVKVSRTYGPFSTTYDAWNRSNRNVKTFSLAVGEQLGIGIANDMLNTLLTAGMAGIQATQAKIGDGLSTFDYSNIVDGLASYGDKAGSIKMLVMHSNTYFSIVDKGLSMTALDSVGGMTIREGGAYSLGLPVLVTDSPALSMTTGYGVIGLTSEALKGIESDDTIMKTQDIIGKENLGLLMQGEGSFNVGVKGCKFDDAIGNPTNAQLGDSANWSYQFSDTKSGAGFVLNVAPRA